MASFGAVYIDGMVRYVHFPGWLSPTGCSTVHMGKSS